jgi:hypothetical protein
LRRSRTADRRRPSSLPTLPARTAPRADGESGFVAVAELARGYPRRVVRRVVADESSRGHLERDAAGKVRLRRGAFEPAVLAAFELLGLNT